LSPSFREMPECASGELWTNTSFSIAILRRDEAEAARGIAKFYCAVETYGIVFPVGLGGIAHRSAERRTRIQTHSFPANYFRRERTRSMLCLASATASSICGVAAFSVGCGKIGMSERVR
jgi:hypothetical protein